MAGRLELGFTFGTNAAKQKQRGESDPMRILLVGDFGGRAAHGDHTIGKPVKTDAGDLDKAVARIAPRLPPSVAGSESIAVDTLEGLHPDHLYAKLPVFAEAREIRKLINDQKRFEEGAAALERWLKLPAPQEAPVEKTEDTLARLLGGAVKAQKSAPQGLDALIANIVSAHVVPDVSARKKTMLEALDGVLSARMKNVLADPAFRTLDAAWRGAHRVISHVDTDAELEVYLLDASKAALAKDLAASSANLEKSALHQVLAERAYSVIAVAFTFGADDLQLLATLGAVGGRAGAPVLATAEPDVAGAKSVKDLADPNAWAKGEDVYGELRKSPVAKWIALTLPRIIERAPYGKKTDPIESFPFEEGTDTILWGSPSLAVAMLLGAGFRAVGWAASPGEYPEVDDLATPTTVEDGETKLVPCTEVVLPERAMNALIAKGFMPILPRAGRGAARFPRFQSIADPPAPIAGPWGG